MIADMLGDFAAAEIPALRAVRPVNGSRHDAYPWACYETADMRNRRRLNCASRKYDGIVRFYVSGATYAQCNEMSERLKDVLIGHAQTGTHYDIKRCNMVDETDIEQSSEREDEQFFVKSIDFQVTAVKKIA